MISRTINLISNIYNLLPDNSVDPLGDYCVFGPYDAMTINENFKEWGSMTDSPTAGTDLAINNEQSIQYKITCITPSDNVVREVNFIKRIKNNPFLFVSFLLLKHTPIQKKH